MGKKAMVTVHPAYRIGDISPRLFGAFLEPIGSMVDGNLTRGISVLTLILDS